VAGVALEAVTKEFPATRGGEAVRAVDDVTLDIPDREFMVLLGPSGCGKSTLLRLICGLEDPTSGTVRIGDRRVNDVLPKDRDVAMVFQSYALYPHKTVAANIEFPLKARGVGRAERAQAAKEAAGLLGLGELLHRRPGALSGGQRQRVALARAIVRRPAVFCMDEPLSNLDAKLRGETRAELVALHRRVDATFVYVTHDQVEAMTMGSRVAVMNRGRVEQVGTPQEVYARPASVFVAQFIGTPPMNVLSQGALDGSGHLIGARPEDVEITPHGALEATVTLVELLGHETLVTTTIADGHPVVLRLPASATPPRAGDIVRLDVADRHRHRFDPDSGRRIDAGVPATQVTGEVGMDVADLPDLPLDAGP
jgi:ABC-type sugar transport system ATPase subunit